MADEATSNERPPTEKRTVGVVQTRQVVLVNRPKEKPEDRQAQLAKAPQPIKSNELKVRLEPMRAKRSDGKPAKPRSMSDIKL